MLYILLLICFQIFVVFCELPHSKFEYKYSFKGPYLAQKDGTVPFWEHFGNAIASEEMVRITPSLRSKKGSIWTKNKTAFDWWQVEVVFRVNGRGRLGADGFAFWYTENKGVEGPVFGSNDNWVGLGVFFDSFDNDNRGNNPYIMAMYNDGTKTFDHQSDGVLQQLAGCQRDFRNKPFPVRAKIEYYKNILTILFHNGNSNNDEDFELCVRAENVYLPQYGHFGLSAATGGLADDHDALKFLTYSLYPPGTQPTSQNIGDAEKEKFSKEYEEYKDKLEKQKEEYRKEHPDEAKRREMEFNPDDAYETAQQRELQQIFQGQSSIFEILRGLHRKIDEVIGRQERALSMLSAVQTGGIPQGQGIPPPQVAGGGGLGRHEIEALLGGQREIVQSARDIKSFVTDIHQKTGQIIAKQSDQGKPTGGGLAFEANTLFNEVKESLNIVKRDLAAVAAKSQISLSPKKVFLELCLSSYENNNSRINQGLWNPSELPFDCLQRLITILFIQLLRDPMTQINGFKIIHDFKGTSIQHLKFVTPRNLHLLYHGAINCIPGRYKEFHFVNESFVLKTLWTVLKPFLSEKIRSRVVFHSSPEGLLNYFPSSVLPLEYGGTLRDTSDTKDWVKLANKYHEEFTIEGQPNFY